MYRNLKRLLKKIHGYINYNRTVTIRNKKFVVPVIRNMGLLNLSLKEEWFRQLLIALKLPPGSAFIDVGVNVGQTLLAFRSCYDNPYWGFEPNPGCISYLNSLIEMNHFEKTHIVPVGHRTGRAFVRKRAWQILFKERGGFGWDHCSRVASRLLQTRGSDLRAVICVRQARSACDRECIGCEDRC
jgi:predicted component of type VI protein secretion system